MGHLKKVRTLTNLTAALYHKISPRMPRIAKSDDIYLAVFKEYPRVDYFFFFCQKNESKSRERLEEEVKEVEEEWKIPPSCSVKCPSSWCGEQQV